MHKLLDLAIICGGPSKERGISFNSARSLLDHLCGEPIRIHPIYVDYQKHFYEILPSQLYSNTPSDFDFKLGQTAQFLDSESIVQKLKSVDLVFPCIHGAFGEDGELQAFLEKNNIPYIGPTSSCCKKIFSKHTANNTLSEQGYPTLSRISISKDFQHAEQRIKTFFKQHHLTRAIVKPSAGGSSIGVHSVSSVAQAIEKTYSIFEQGIDSTVIIEAFCEGREFTVMLFENEKREPVAFLPTEIEISYENHQIFDYRRKYLPTSNTRYYTPARFYKETIESIRETAQEIFKLFQVRDFARFDGWLMPNGQIYFSDFNPISGLEQNSFIFRQSSILGFTHRDILVHLIRNACARENIEYPSTETNLSNAVVDISSDKVVKQSPLFVLFGGQTAERQISLMSGTNVFLKLRLSAYFKPEAYLWDIEGFVWHLPYSYLLNHTVEEIIADCQDSLETDFLNALTEAVRTVQNQFLTSLSDYSPEKNRPTRYTMNEFLTLAQEKQAFVFLGLHGGKGENGHLQKMLDQKGLRYNGSGLQGSYICMDKYLTGEKIKELQNPNIQTVPKVSVSMHLLLGLLKENQIDIFWNDVQSQLQTSTLIIKPRKDGCSAGVIQLHSAGDLERYIELLKEQVAYIPPNTFSNQTCIVEMPCEKEDFFLLEAFIEVDFLRIIDNAIVHQPKLGWVEMTVGVLEEKGKYHSLNPSLTVAEGTILSLEEKFQGGTGINITPPPEILLSKQQVQKIRQLVEVAAQALCIENYARLDIFYNRLMDQLFIIEANTLPALTPSTVIYHQALAEEPAMSPRTFLEHIIQSKIQSTPTAHLEPAGV